MLPLSYPAPLRGIHSIPSKIASQQNGKNICLYVKNSPLWEDDFFAGLDVEAGEGVGDSAAEEVVGGGIVCGVGFLF